MDWRDNLVAFPPTLVSGPVFSIEHRAIRVSPWIERIMPIIQNWYQSEAEKEMWNKTGLLSPITSGSQLSELFIESESDWHLQVKEWEAPGAEWDQLYCWHSAILGELEGRLCQPSPTYNHWSTTYDMPQSLFEIVSLQLSITLRYVIYVPVFFLVHPPQACPGSQWMCVHEERYWLQFLKHLEIMRHSFWIIFQIHVRYFFWVFRKFAPPACQSGDSLPPGGFCCTQSLFRWGIII